MAKKIENKVEKKVEKNEISKLRKYADFFPDKSPIDKELLEIFFPENGFQHDSLGLMTLNTNDTIKSALIYFKKNVIDVEKQAKNIEQNKIKIAEKEVKEKNSKINLE